ncbi:hypothetical protein DMO16_00005, partial [Fictibacillus sp. S7]
AQRLDHFSLFQKTKSVLWKSPPMLFVSNRACQLFLIQLPRPETRSFQPFPENKKRFMEKSSNAFRL